MSIITPPQKLFAVYYADRRGYLRNTVSLFASFPDINLEFDFRYGIMKTDSLQTIYEADPTILEESAVTRMDEGANTIRFDCSNKISIIHNHTTYISGQSIRLGDGADIFTFRYNDTYLDSFCAIVFPKNMYTNAFTASERYLKSLSRLRASRTKSPQRLYDLWTFGKFNPLTDMRVHDDNYIIRVTDKSGVMRLVKFTKLWYIVDFVTLMNAEQEFDATRMMPRSNFATATNQFYNDAFQILVFDYYTGGDTSHIWILAPINVQLQIIAKTLYAASKLHESGLVHGDLKWDNVYYNTADPSTPYIGDLERISRVGSVYLGEKCTPSFGSPEIKGNLTVSKPEHDVWSLIVSLAFYIDMNRYTNAWFDPNRTPETLVAECKSILDNHFMKLGVSQTWLDDLKLALSINPADRISAMELSRRTTEELDRFDIAPADD